MIQPDLFSQPKARRTDPQTSWDAARSVENLSIVQQSIMWLLELRPMSDEEIYGHLGPDLPVSPSGLRTRRKELVEKGLVVDSGERGLTRSGRQTIKWRLA